MSDMSREYFIEQFGILAFIDFDVKVPSIDSCTITDYEIKKRFSSKNVISVLKEYNAKTLLDGESTIEIYWSGTGARPEGITGSDIFILDKNLYNNGEVWILRLIDDERDIGIRFKDCHE